MWNLNTGHLAFTAVSCLLFGGILGFFFARWWFLRQFKKIEKKYQQSVPQTYREIGKFFGRKMKEEDLNRITAQIEGEAEKKKISPKKPKPKKKK
jgi:hypothetical protein